MDYIELKIEKFLNNLTIREILLKLHLGKEKIYQYEIDKAFLLNDFSVNQNAKCQTGDILKIKINENFSIVPTPSNLEVVYEDENYLFVNKPRGVLIHDDGNKNINTLSNMVANYYKNHHIRREVRYCNRIDVDTEGLVAFAKNDLAQSYLNYQIEQRKVIKKYYAVCHNRFSKKEGIVNEPISSDRHDNKKMIVYRRGKEAITEYKVIKNGEKSLVDLVLHTGRTHQIRVHMAFMNHPLYGDNLYGVEDDASCLMLQAYKFEYFDPFKTTQINVELPLSKDLKGELDAR